VLKATTPVTPSSPKPVRSGLLGGVVGIFLALVAIALAELRNRRLTEEDARSVAFGVPVLAFITRPRSPFSLRGAAGGDRRQNQGYDRLAGQLQLAARRGAARTSLVTSPSRGAGKTSVTLRLARALALLGNRVIVVQTDVHEDSGASPLFAGHGLTGVVLGQSSVTDELVDLDVRTLAPTNTPDPVHSGSIAVLPAGQTGPAQQLSSQVDIGETMRQCLGRRELGDAIKACRALADFVLIDAPAIEGLHVAPALIDAVDASMLVVRVGWTPTEAVADGVRTLDGLGARPLGLVVTGSRHGDPDAAPTPRRADELRPALASAGAAPSAADLASYRRGHRP
jgi:Mrp family chromosome partitioning ATPase